MSMRKITSTTLLVSLLVLIVNSVVLYVVPEGRVAYWADWRFLGLSKSQWGDQHVTVGVLFLIAGVLHLYYNWSVIMAYLKNRAKRVVVFTRSFIVAVLLTTACVLGTLFELPPFSTIVEISASFKEAGAERYGEPPYGHAELSSLRSFAEKQQLNLDMSVELLRGAGIRFDGADETLQAIAERNGITPQQVYTIMKNGAAKERPAPSLTSFPEAPEAGWGNRRLADICTAYGLDLETVLQGMAEAGIDAEGAMKIKDIAARNQRDPMQIFETIRALATPPR